LVCGTINDQTNPIIASDGSGGAIIAWQDTRAGAPGVYAQRVNSAGVRQWQTTGVAICTTVGSHEELIAMSDGTGGAILAWVDTRTGGQRDIYAQRVNAAGARLWTTNGLRVCN